MLRRILSLTSPCNGLSERETRYVVPLYVIISKKLSLCISNATPICHILTRPRKRIYPYSGFNKHSQCNIISFAFSEWRQVLHGFTEAHSTRVVEFKNT